MNKFDEEFYHELKNLKNDRGMDLKKNYPYLYQLLLMQHEFFESKKQQSKINETTQQKEHAAS